MEKKSFQLGDIVRMKKPHPCGANEWLIVRTGMDFRLKCQGCGHYVLLPRTKFERMARQLLGHIEVQAPADFYGGDKAPGAEEK